MSHPPEKPPQNSDLHDDLLKYWDTANAQSHRYKSRFRSNDPAENQSIVHKHRDFTQIVMTVWFQPSVQNYRELLHDPDISLKRSSIWVVAAWGVQLLLGLCLLSMIGPEEFAEIQGRELSESSDDGEAETSLGSVLCAAVVCLPLLAMVGLLFYMILIVGIPHLAAQLLGGGGILEETAFLYAAVYAPSSVMGALLNLLWQGSDSNVILGVVLLFSLYSFGLLTVAIRAAHHLNWVASVVSVLALPIVGFGLIFMCSLFS